MKMQRGSTIIEVLGALTIGMMILVGLANMTDNALEETKGQQAAAYQSQVAAAAARYIKDNYETLLTQATTTAPAPPRQLSALQPAYLSSSFSPTNPYGQTPCLLVMKNAAGHLDALVVNEGGTQIPAREIAYAASKTGQGGGYIPSTTSGTLPPLVARGAYGAWSLSSAALSTYLSAKCTSSTANAGSLVTAIFYNGPGQLATDYLYRNAVPGRPELNTMTTPLYLKNQGGVAVENTSDATCAVGNPATYGGITTNAAGEVLSCQAGIWRQQNRFWREPVTTYAALPMTSNTVGDTRMVTGSVNRAFTWTGSSWAALSVDQNGDMVVPNRLQLNSTATLNAACQLGQVARDASGALMSCQSNTWNYVSHRELQYSDSFSDFAVLRSKHLAYAPGTYYTGSMPHDASSNMHYAEVTKTFTLTRDGLLQSMFYGYMARRLISASYDFSHIGKFCLNQIVTDNDTNTQLVNEGPCTSWINNDFTQEGFQLIKWLPKNNAGYTLKLRLYWTVGSGNPNDNIYDVSNYHGTSGGVAQDTPLDMSWRILVTS